MKNNEVIKLGFKAQLGAMFAQFLVGLGFLLFLAVIVGLVSWANSW